MSGIFISYRRDDSAGYAGWLADDLKDCFPAELIFMDVTGIAPGMDFRSVIEERVGACNALLAVIGRSWLTGRSAGSEARLQDPGDFVRYEIAVALKRNIPVIPVLVDGATMPAAGDLPQGLQELAWRNAVELRHARWEADVQVLLAALGKILPNRGERPQGTARTAMVQPAAATARQPASSLRWPLTLIVAASAIVIVALAIAVLAPWRGDPSPDAAGGQDPLSSQGSTTAAGTGGDGSYPATLPAGVEVTVGTATYRVLSARLERLNPDRLALIFLMRMTSNKDNGDNFWSASFRLMVDGVPRAPVNSLNELVQGYSAEEGEVVFEIDPGIVAAQLQIIYYDESTRIPIDLTAAVPGMPPISARTSIPGPFPKILAAGAEVKVEPALYRVLSASIERYNMEKLALKLSVRMTNTGNYGANFWDASFRLLVDGVPRAPISRLNLIVEGNSAKDGEVIFVFDDTVEELTLLVGHGKDKIKVPLDLNARNAQ